MSIKTNYDVIVIGGGAAEMMAAGRAGMRGLSVLLIEKNPVLGKKLSITGGGRCNVTNAEFDNRTLLQHYGEAQAFLHAPFSQFSSKDTEEFFTERNLPVVVEDRKRAFPHTHKATDVVRVMEQFVKENNVEVLLNASVENFEVKEGKIVGVKTNKGIFTATSYVIASGGRSHPETGSTGEGFGWLYALGHTTHTSNPNLVPLVVKEKWVEKIAGTIFQNAQTTFANELGKVSKQGNVLATHFGLSGPTILNSAYEVQQLLKKGTVTAKIDLFPKQDIGTLRARFQLLSEEHGNKTLHNALREWFPSGVVTAILMTAGGDLSSEKMHSLPRDIRHKIVDAMKSIEFTVTGVKGFDWAVVSDGGVDLKEIDTRTMHSKLHPNSFIIGDVLHVNRPSGGYSLQLCWTTGWVAGSNA